MKTKITLVVALIFAATFTTKAQQQQGFQRKTVEERVQAAMQKISDPLKLDKDEQDKTTVVLTDFYTQQDKMRQDARASENRPDRSAMEKMTKDRDEKLKTIFTEDQFKKFKAEVEPSMHPQRKMSGQGTGNS